MQRIFFFILILLPILFFLTRFIGKTLVAPSGKPFIRWSLWGLIIASALCIPLHFMIRILIMQQISTTHLVGLQYGMGLFSLLGCAAAAIFVGKKIAQFVSHKAIQASSPSPAASQDSAPTEQLPNWRRRDLLTTTSRLAAWGWATGFFAYTANQASKGPTLYPIIVPITGLPTALENFKIVQISDLHIGQIRQPEYFHRLVELSNQVSPDLIAVTGDLVDGTPGELGQLALILGGLKSRYGCYFVTGNHEYYSGADAWVTFLRDHLGWKILQNQNDILTINTPRGSTQLAVVGVNDYKAERFSTTAKCNPEQAFANLPANIGMTLFLAHQPKTADLHTFKVDLQLSGHTHAGQYFPATWIIHAVQPYVQGLCKKASDRSWIYVNSGTGYWGPALRSTDKVGEISVLTLQNANT